MAKAPNKPVKRAAPAAGVPAAPAPVLPAWAIKLTRYRGLIVPVGFVLLLGVLLVPMPPAVMDVLIALNISLSMIILLTTIYMGHPLDFSVFPSLLLATTLFRLVLNIASTRLVLSADAGSPEQAMAVAGHVIMAFGNFVAGDSLFVGVVIFLILVIVQFVVITKGASRISEVAARFTLDAMPGKQMAIDSDLSAGMIDETEARRRRERIAQEADFFGAMDGASKFVRGDAVAGIIITVINILGGFGVGMISRGWDAAETAKTFTKLTIGDGLTSQIPSFIIAIASALIVTRSGDKQQELGDQLTGQIVSQPKGLIITAIFLAGLSLTPLPTVPLLATAAVLAGIAYAMTRATRESGEAARKAEATPVAAEPPPVESLLKVDTLELEVGYGLVSLVDAAQGGDLLDRIAAIRRQIAAELGLVMPPVRIRDNMQLAADAYRLKIRGSPIAEGVTHPGKLLAMDSGIASGPIQGEQTREPAFGLTAWWIDPALRARAETMNYTVVDATSVLGTHVTEVVKRHSDELLTREEVNNLLEQLKQRSPKLIEDTVPALIKTADLQKILQNLLRERVSIRDIESILEALAEWAPRTKDIDVLTEYVRNALGRTICKQYVDEQDKLWCLTLDPALEDLINSHIERSERGVTNTMPPNTAQQIVKQVAARAGELTQSGRSAVIVCSPQVRSTLRRMIEPSLPHVAVLAFNEISAEVSVEAVAMVGVSG